VSSSQPESGGERFGRNIVKALGLIVSLIWVRPGFWLVSKGPKRPVGTPQVLSVTTDEDRAWIKKAQEARMSQLESVRTAAKDWGTTITAVTGALGIVALIKGPEEVGRLTHGWQVAVGIALLVAILLVIRGIVLAALAAQGTPGSFTYSPVRYHDYYRREIARASIELQGSRLLVVAGMLALIAGVGMTWYGDEKEKKTTLVYAVSRDGVTACGEVSRGKQGVLQIKKAGQTTPTTLEPKNVLALVPVGECP
jgi:hypothetical protein